MLREGRLGGAFDTDVASYTSSLDFDRNIAGYDVLGSMAHAVMLCESGIIEKGEAAKILSGLLDILESAGDLRAGAEVEDIHMAIEKELIESIGEAGGKLHTARSRNDQIALDLRMWVRGEIFEISGLLFSLEKTLLELCKEHTETVLPGYTHMQRAQPTTLAHHVLSYVDAFMRDVGRLSDAYLRINLSPLGACAFASTSFPIDAERTASLLGFDDVMGNAMDAVSSRDFITEMLSCLAITGTDVSRLASELILWSGTEFGFIEIGDEFASTSSIMPQKKNPDVLEIMRARTSIVSGNLAAGLSMVKGLSNSYNRDFQELSPLLYDSLKITKESLALLEKIMKTVQINRGRMADACDEGFTTATELADLLVKEKGMSFRTAHQIIGKAVKKAIEAGKRPSEIDSRFLEGVTGWPEGIAKNKIEDALSSSMAVKAKNAPGGPAPEACERAITARAKSLSRREKDLKDRIKKVEDSKAHLLKTAKELGGG